MQARFKTYLVSASILLTTFAAAWIWVILHTPHVVGLYSMNLPTGTSTIEGMFTPSNLASDVISVSAIDCIDAISANNHVIYKGQECHPYQDGRIIRVAIPSNHSLTPIALKATVTVLRHDQPGIFATREAKPVHMAFPILLVIGTCSILFFLRKNMWPALALIVALWLSAHYCMISTPVESQYDMEGHMAYTQILLDHHRLPHMKESFEAYHPPLYHMGLALWSSLHPPQNAFSTTVTRFFHYQVFAWILFALSLITGALLWRELEKKISIHPIAAILFSLVASHLTFSGRVNNDVPMVFLSLLAIAFTLIYLHRPRPYIMWILGLISAIAILVKFTGIIIWASEVFFVGVIVFKRHRSWRMLLRQISVVAIPSLMVVIWIFARSQQDTGVWLYSNFEQLSWMQHPSDTISNIIRFVKIDPVPFFNEVNSAHWGGDLRSTLFLYTFANWIQSDIFYSESNRISSLTLRSTCFLTICAGVIGLIRNIQKRSCPSEMQLLMILSIFTWVLFVVLNVASPYPCSMDARYFATAFFSFAILIGNGFSALSLSPHRSIRLTSHFLMLATCISLGWFYLSFPLA